MPRITVLPEFPVRGDGIVSNLYISYRSTFFHPFPPSRQKNGAVDFCGHISDASDGNLEWNSHSRNYHDHCQQSSQYTLLFLFFHTDPPPLFFSKRLNDSIDAPGSCFIHRISIRSYTIRQHITIFLIHIVTPSIDPVPSSGHSSAWSEEIPLLSVFQPALPASFPDFHH